MRRYQFLEKEKVFEALNRLRNAFLAAKDGNEVEEIIKGVLTYDERLKIGRRIQISEYLISGYSIDKINEILKVGRNTVSSVAKSLSENPNCFKLLNLRVAKVEDEYKNKKYRLEGGSKKVFKTKVYTGFKRKDVKR